MSNRKEQLGAQFAALCESSEQVKSAHAELQAALGENSNSPNCLWAQVGLVDALKKAKVPAIDANDMARIAVQQVIGPVR